MSSGGMAAWCWAGRHCRRPLLGARPECEDHMGRKNGHKQNFSPQQLCLRPGPGWGGAKRPHKLASSKGNWGLSCVKSAC